MRDDSVVVAIRGYSLQGIQLPLVRWARQAGLGAGGRVLVGNLTAFGGAQSPALLQGWDVSHERKRWAGRHNAPAEQSGGASELLPSIAATCTHLVHSGLLQDEAALLVALAGHRGLHVAPAEAVVTGGAEGVLDGVQAGEQDPVLRRAEAHVDAEAGRRKAAQGQRGGVGRNWAALDSWAGAGAAGCGTHTSATR